MTIREYRTTELSQSFIEKYLKVYNEVFELDKSVDEFKNQYLNTSQGYSLHTILFDDEDIVGAYALIPLKYKYKGKELMLGLGVDLFIKDGYREDINNLLTLLGAVINNAKANNIAGCFGFPNDNSNYVSMAFLKEKRIGLLDTYILPYRVGDYKSGLKFLNPLSILCSKFLMGLSCLDKSQKIVDYVIKKGRPEFDQTRWKWLKPNEYHHYEEDGVKATWKTTRFEGIKACFLMDVYPMGKYNFDKVVRKMVKMEKDNVGLFLYVGHLNFIPLSMIKMPRKFEPKTFRFDFRILDKENLSKIEVYNLDNWEVNLSSYDLL